MLSLGEGGGGGEGGVDMGQLWSICSFSTDQISGVSNTCSSGVKCH